MGHIQSGGEPTAGDRVLAARLGIAAVAALADGDHGTMVGVRGEVVRRVPLEEVVGRERPLDPELYELAISTRRDARVNVSTTLRELTPPRHAPSVRRPSETLETLRRKSLNILCYVTVDAYDV